MKKSVKKILQPLMAFFLVMAVSVSCEFFFGTGGGKDDDDDPKVMTFIGTIGANRDGGVGQGVQTPCFISWEKGKSPIVEPIEGIILGYGDHPKRSGQAGNYMLITSGRESVRREYYTTGWTSGVAVPYLIDLKTREWTYLPHITGNKEKRASVHMSTYFVSPDGKKVYYAFQRGTTTSSGEGLGNNANDGIIVCDIESGESKEIGIQGLLNAVGYKSKYIDRFGDERSHGWFLTLHCITPDSKTLIGTIRYHVTYEGFSGWQGGVSKIFRYDISTDKFDLIVGDSEGTPSFTTILNDNETLYFCNYGYGFSHYFKYNLKTRKVTKMPDDFKGMSGLSMSNHIRLDNQGLLQAGGTNNNYYHSEVNGKLEVVKFKNLPYPHQNSLQFNKSRSKVYALKTSKEKNYYVELQGVDAEAPLDTLFTLPPNVGNLMQIW